MRRRFGMLILLVVLLTGVAVVVPHLGGACDPGEWVNPCKG